MRPDSAEVSVYMVDGVIKCCAQVSFKGMTITRERGGIMDEKAKVALQKALREALLDWDIGVDNV